MLERLWNQDVLQKDFMVQQPHMAFTVYDEVAVLLRWITGLGFEPVLIAQQFLLRVLGLLGVFLIATSFKLSTRLALLVTALYSLGATIGGPTVLSIEYEPVPRGFAVPLVFLAIGLAAHERYVAAGVSASIGFLYHPTTALAFWAIYAGFVAWSFGRPSFRRRLTGLYPLAAAVVVLMVISRLQPGESAQLNIFGKLEPWWEQMLRLRATYIWVSMWIGRWAVHYLVLLLVVAGAYWRVRPAAAGGLRVFMVALPIVGLLSVPASYLLLDVGKYTLGPQLQLTRHMLFITVIAGLLSSVAGMQAALAGRRIEGLFWFAVALAVPIGDPINWTVLPGFSDPMVLRHAILVCALAVGLLLVVWVESKHSRWSVFVLAAFLLLPFFLYPSAGKVKTTSRLREADLSALAQWARSSTPVGSVFLFPDAGRELHPGIFRATALRAVYVDWKSGGQGNYIRNVASEWWKRWRQMRELRYVPGPSSRYASSSIDFIVLKRKSLLPLEPEVFGNSSYAVYRVR
jgi:hypothetical protein